MMVSVAVDCVPVPTAAGSWPNARLTVSSLRSESFVVDIVNVLVLLPDAKLTVVLVGEKSPFSAFVLDEVIGMSKSRSAAGETVTVKVPSLPSLTVRLAGEKTTSN